MRAAFESRGFEVPEFDLANDLPGSLRAGLETLRLAAAERGLLEETVVAVFVAAFDPFGEFTASQADGYNAVVEASISVNGWAWTDACIVDSDSRREKFSAVFERAVGYASKHFPALHEHDRVAVVEDLLYLELSGAWIHSTVVDAELPGWMIPGVVFGKRGRLKRRLLDAKGKLVDREREVTVRRGDSGVTYGIQSWDKFVEALGEREPMIRPMWDVPVDEAGIESVVWAAARVILTDRAETMIQSARAGSARDKVTLTVAAAEWVLTRGSQDSVNQQGEPVSGSSQELRHKYAQDSLLVCFLGLRASAPATWGTYPETAVPTREVIEQVAAEAKARADVNAAWFACLEARRVEVAKSGRVLHGVRRLVESLIEEAARDTDM
jgi:hypothetical protein